MDETPRLVDQIDAADPLRQRLQRGIQRRDVGNAERFHQAGLGIGRLAS